MKRDGNLCLVDINLANWQHFTKCIIKYVLNTCVIVYLLGKIYNCLERVNFSFLRTLTCLKAAFTMLSLWFVQFPSDAKVNHVKWIHNLGNLARLFADDTSLSYFGRNYDIMKSDINNELSKLNTRLKLYAFTVIYLLLVAIEIFKSTFYSYYFFVFWDISPYWSLA
jgi:hypothetical protein